MMSTFVLKGFLPSQNTLSFFVFCLSTLSLSDGSTWDYYPVKENMSLYQQINCENKRENVTRRLLDANVTFCPAFHDTLICWGPIFANTTQYMPCPLDPETQYIIPWDGSNESVLVKPDRGKYSFRSCDVNGEWKNNLTDYTLCYQPKKEDLFQKYVSIIYVVGYTISFISLTLAVTIFVYFKKLMCLRNKIHCHFFLSIILRIITYFLNLSFRMIGNTEKLLPLCYFVGSMNEFTGLAKFLWMLVEGMYLILVIIWTFGLDRLKLWNFGIGAWGVPLILTTISLIIRKFRGYKCDDIFTNVNWFVNGFILVSLAINLGIAVFIARTLLTKMQDTQRLQRHVSRTSRIKETHWRTMRSVLILIPLLGLSYVVFITPPHKSFRHAWIVINAVLSSTQGFFVALLFCFLNHEVQGAIKSGYQSWKDRRGVPRYSYSRSNSLFIDQTLTQRRQSALNSKRLSRRDPAVV